MNAENPILNNPYLEPARHYATNLEGELDYDRPVEGRRVFDPTIASNPIPRGGQMDLLGSKAVAPTDHLINVLRREVKSWRDANYPNVTRVTGELLRYWFKNEERDFTQSLFFAQQEAIETAIFLNEVAESSNAGQRILQDLEKGRAATGNLPRLAFKMATGSGKTVVMAALIVYHFYNRQEYRGDTRFADNFLVLAPGITIRDRLAVLRVDPRSGTEATDYYQVRMLVPQAWRPELRQLNARITIVNFQQLMARTLQGNKRSPFDGKMGKDGKKTEAVEDPAQVVRRVCKFKPDTRLLIINDEAHHCYLPKVDDRVAEGEDTDKENERAAVWFNGLREIAQRFKVRTIYDLSATPYYLTGSGHEPYTLFEWVVSDFGLIEAIESGLVKIPFMPVSDDTQAPQPVLRNLYEHVKGELPRAGQRRQRARAREGGETLREAPPSIPPLVKAAFEQFYKHYEEDFKTRRHSARGRADAQLQMDDTPPVFIVVCNNTSVSKEVFKYIAGYEQPGLREGDPPKVVPGVYPLLSNYDPATLQPVTKPPTLLIDSDALENSGQVDDEFKKVFAREIEMFKRDYARLHGQGAAERIEDAEILREVMNTVGQRNMLGAHIRCVVSVSMLTEGWDAKTVTHIAGLRAFGSQLLCEQVAGRALRRKSYFLQGYDKAGQPTTDKRKIVDWRFPPEYAHIIGVPFKLFKGGRSVIQPPVDAKRVHALRERTDRYEITFPCVEGYRVDYPEGDLTYSFDGMEDYEVDGSMLPTRGTLAAAIGDKTVKLSLDNILAMREQNIIFHIAKDLLRTHFADADGNPQFQRFHQLTAIVADWYANKVRVLHKDACWKKVLYFHSPQQLVAHVVKAIHTGTGAEQRIRPILNYYNPTASTRFVHGQTTKEVFPTKHSHVNFVVMDSGWEGRAAKVLDDLADEGRVQAWVKNSFLDFRIPYTDALGVDRQYFPDFIVRATDGKGQPVHLIVEISGEKRDKAEKVWSAVNRWLPAANAIREKHGWPRWDFLEIAGDIRDARNLILDKLEAGAS